MPYEVIISLVTAISSLVGAGIGAWSASKLTNYRLEQLEKKVDALAHTEERLSLIEQRMAMYEKEKKS